MQLTFETFSLALLTIRLVSASPASSAAGNPDPTTEAPTMKYECDKSPQYKPPLIADDCLTVLKRGFEHIFSSSIDYRLTHNPHLGQTDYIYTPFHFDDGHCQMVIDFKEEGFAPIINIREVVQAGKTVIQGCVDGEYKHGGSIFPLDRDRLATLWIQHRQLVFDPNGVVSTSNGTEVGAAQLTADDIATA